MADETPTRRSKTPIPAANVPPTPSRIPVPTQPARPFSSFASPTKSSLARLNPQLLARAKSTEPDIGASANREKIKDVFDRALGNTPQGGRGRAASGADRPVLGRNADGNKATPSRTPTRARSVGGGMTSKPRRMSRSPSKRPPIASETPRSNFKPAAAFGFENIQSIANPFVKKGLRRSPVPGQSSQATADSQVEQLPGDFNPFKKTGLRRSPQPLDKSIETAETHTSPVMEADVSTTPKDPPPSQPAVPLPFTLEPPKSAEKVAIRSRALIEPENLQTEEPFEPIESSEPAQAHPVEEALAASPIERTVSQSEENIDIGSPGPAHQIVSTTPTDPIPQRTEPISIDEPQIPENPESIYAAEVLQSSDQISIESPSNRKSQQFLMSRSAQRQLFQPPGRPTPVSPSTSKRAQPEEPELPPTPTQRGIADPIVTTPPIGIHNTPSKTARRNKTLGQKLKSSPLKPRAEPPIVAASPEPPPKRRKSARFTIPHDPHAAKKKTRDDLLEELQQLQADISLANKENERIRLHQESNKSKPSRPPNSEELLALLQRSTASEKSVPKPIPISALNATNLFLPFSSRRKIQSTPLPPNEKPLPSHLPIPLNNPLPYLQVFSPLTYTSNITLLPPEPGSPNESTLEVPMASLQRHEISTSHLSGLFNARLSMIVDTSSLRICSINIDKLDPNAEPELGPFVRLRASEEGPFGKDIGTICWAMSRWTEVSVTRAKFWCDVEREFGTAEARKNSAQKFGAKKRKRKIVGDDEEGDAEEEMARKWSRKDLFRQMGRMSMVIKAEDVTMMVHWKIGFDWVGDVESHIDVDLDMPRSWHEQDDRNSLSKIKDMFGKLVRGKGPLSAVRIVVGLVMIEKDN